MERTFRRRWVKACQGPGRGVGQSARRHGARIRGYERPRGRAERLGRGILELAVPQHLPSIQERRLVKGRRGRDVSHCHVTGKHPD